MKRGTTTHHKTEELAVALGVARWGAVGILECLWHTTSERTPHGDIGKLTDKQIAFYVGWNDDPAVLIAALVSVGWLDEHPEHRLIVHDWHEHCDDTTKKRVQRSGTRFVSDFVGTCPDKTGQCRILSDHVPTKSACLSHSHSPSPSHSHPSGGESEGMDGKAKALADAGIGGKWASVFLASPVTAAEIRAEAARCRGDPSIKNVRSVVATVLAQRHGLALPGKKRTATNSREAVLAQIRSA